MRVLLGGGQGGLGAGRALDIFLAAEEQEALVLAEDDVALDPGVDQRGGEGAIVETPARPHSASPPGERSSGGANSGTTVPSPGSRPARR